MTMRGADLVRHTVVADSHDNLLFFTRAGKVYCLKCYDIPEDSSRVAKGISLVNLLPIDLKDGVTALLAVADFSPNMFLLMATKAGVIKKTSLDKFAKVRRNGVIAVRLKNQDELVATQVVTDADEVILASQNGQAIRFKVKDLRIASRASGGVRGIRLIHGDRVVSMGFIFPDAYSLTITEEGFGKLTPVGRYPVHKRGGKGIRAHRVSAKTGKVMVADVVSSNGQLLLLSAKGNVISIPIEDISIQGRNSGGVHLMGLHEGDAVVSGSTFSRLTAG
jgi:DNA gyrase subunit A